MKCGGTNTGQWVDILSVLKKIPAKDQKYIVLLVSLQSSLSRFKWVHQNLYLELPSFYILCVKTWWLKLLLFGCIHKLYRISFSGLEHAVPVDVLSAFLALFCLSFCGKHQFRSYMTILVLWVCLKNDTISAFPLALEQDFHQLSIWGKTHLVQLYIIKKLS